MKTGRSSGGVLQGHVVAEALEALYKIASEATLVAAVEVIGPQVLIDGSGLAEDVVGDDEDAVADGNSGFLLSMSGSKPVVLAAEVGLGAAGCMGRFNEKALEPAVALAGSSAVSLAGALVHPRTHLPPGSEVIGVEELRHIDAKFGDQATSARGAN